MFSLATSKRWKDKATQEQKDKTSWHNVVVFGEGLVGIVEKYVKKGSKVYVEGELNTRKWQDQSGNDRYTSEVVLQGFNCNLTLLDSRKDANQLDSNENQSNSIENTETSDDSLNDKKESDDVEDDIPF